MFVSSCLNFGCFLFGLERRTENGPAAPCLLTSVYVFRNLRMDQLNKKRRCAQNRLAKGSEFIAVIHDGLLTISPYPRIIFDHAHR